MNSVLAAGMIGCAALIGAAAWAPGDAGEPTPTPASQTLSTDAAEIAQALDDFHDAASKSDFDRYFSRWTDRSVFLGTDATERWVGEEFRAFARPYFEQGKGWTYVSRDRRVSLGPDIAFFDELLQNEKLGTCRGSGVLRKVEGRWWIMQYNLSIPIPNALAEGVAARIRQHEAVRGDAEDK